MAVIQNTAVCALLFAVAATIVSTAQARIYFEDDFDTHQEEFVRWIRSEAKRGDDTSYDGEFKIELVDNKTETTEDNYAMVATQANQHYALSCIADMFEFQDKPLVVQYSVRFQQPMACGGSYMKLIAADEARDLSLGNLKDDTLYSILFGPDKCGGDHNLRFIFQFKNPTTGTYREVHANAIPNIQTLIYMDKKSHLVTLILEPNNNFQIQVDENQVAAGKLGSVDDFSERTLIPQKTIDDPDDSKPEDWVDDKEIDDPADVKPGDWVEEAQIEDPSAVKPDDWDDDMDGDWEPPTIANPEYKGVFKAKRIENTAYKGIWRPKQLDNPEYFVETNPFSKLLSIVAVSFELWTITEGTAYDDIIITDDLDEATAAAKAWRKQRDVQDTIEGSGSFMIDTFNKVSTATKEKPWLWGVYALVLFVPIYFLFFATSSESHPQAKAPSTEAAKSEDKIEEEEEEEEEEEDKKEETKDE